MALNLHDAAKRAVNSCELMVNRSKIQQKDLGEKPITIDAVAFIQATGKSGKLERVPVFTCLEHPDKYFFGGQAFANIADAWLEVCEGDIDAVNAALKDSPIKVQLKSVKTANGNSFTQVTVL